MLHVDSASEDRGGQTQLALLIEGMEALGHRALLAAPPRGALASRLGRPVLPLHAGHGLRAAWQLRTHLEASCPDLVAAHTPHAHGLCLAAGCLPVVHRRVDFAVGRSALGRWKLARARLYVAVSGAVARVLARGGVPEGRIRVVHDGVRALPPAAPAPDLCGPGPLVGCIGALVAHKGHRHFLDALARLPGLRGAIAGEGPLRPALERQIAALGLGGRVRLLGQRRDPAAVLAALDLLVHPSVEEGFGQVVVEALLAGRPVVVTDAGGLPELVGPLSAPVPAGDPESLAAAIRARLAEPGPPGPGLARARERFSVEAMVAGTLAAYEEALASARG